MSYDIDTQCVLLGHCAEGMGLEISLSSLDLSYLWHRAMRITQDGFTEPVSYMP